MSDNAATTRSNGARPTPIERSNDAPTTTTHTEAQASRQIPALHEYKRNEGN